MSLTFKLFSLGIRTLAKPIGNYIKRQAKEHDGFRQFAINQAQRVHRIDMRMRLGILHDPAAQERMHERERKAAEEKRIREEMPVVRTEKEQKEHDEQKQKKEKGEKDTPKKKDETKVKIRPLSDARAIELGANFFSEAFIFGVAVGLLLLENWRSRYKESNRRDEVAERIDSLAAQVEMLRQEHDLPELQALSDNLKKSKSQKETYAWYNPAGWWMRVERSSPDGADAVDEKRSNVANNHSDARNSASPSLPPLPASSPDSPPASTVTDAIRTEPPKTPPTEEKPAKVTTKQQQATVQKEKVP